MPVWFSALIFTTGQPNFLLNSSVLMLFPSASARSIMFSATMTGRPVSSSCEVRYRLRSGFVASTTLMTASGFSSSKNLRETTSSGE